MKMQPDSLPCGSVSLVRDIQHVQHKLATMKLCASAKGKSTKCRGIREGFLEEVTV